MMDEGAFSGGNGQPPPPYMANIWQFPVNGGGQGVGESGVGMQGVSMGHFGNGDERNHDVVSVMNDDRMSLCGVGRKRLCEMEGKEARKNVSTSNDNGKCLNDSDVKRLKTPGPGGSEEKSDSKAEAEPSSGKPVDQNSHNPEPPKDYIHVRARRGQATDSHSLAERARREKISERMKILQDLVPGCNKIIGKALVLDEIINYIQSLQRQVEFLSMKLEAVNSRMNPAFDIFPQKDFGQQAFDTDVMPFSSQAAREYSRGSSPEWLHMQVGGNFERTN